MEKFEKLTISQLYEIAFIEWHKFKFLNGQDSQNLLEKCISEIFNPEKGSGYIDENLFKDIEQLIDQSYMGIMQVFL
jgi:hypothetical protein